MKQTKSISSLFVQLSLVVALLAAFVFSASYGMGPHGVASLFTGDAQQESQSFMEQQEEDDERPLSYIGYACNALVPVAAQINFLHQPHFEAPLPPVTDSPEKPHTLPSLPANRYFRTLFRLIISPNAP